MRYTAATTPLLAVIKRQYNAKIYKHALGLFNTQGRTATLDYLDQFTNEENRAKCRARLEADARAEAQRQTDDRARCFRRP